MCCVISFEELTLNFTNQCIYEFATFLPDIEQCLFLHDILRFLWKLFWLKDWLVNFKMWELFLAQGLVGPSIFEINFYLYFLSISNSSYVSLPSLFIFYFIVKQGMVDKCKQHPGRWPSLGHSFNKTTAAETSKFKICVWIKPDRRNNYTIFSFHKQSVRKNF